MESIKSNSLVLLIVLYALIIVLGFSTSKKVNNHSLLHNTVNNTITTNDTILNK